jgi:glycosyltransferase involved in cell wall biosynthesis
MIQIATILPPREMFSPRATGAVGLLVHRLSRATPEVATTIYGMPTEAPFADVDFRPVPLPFLPLRQAARYGVGLARALRKTPPTVIEVHNRPDLALSLARHFPRIPVVLFLHNDPQGMRRARSAVERAHLLTRLALVAPVSTYLETRLMQGVPPSDRVAVFPNCIDLAVIPAAAKQNRILFAGRVVADKGADSFVAACALALPHLPGWRAEMIGADRFGADSPETPFLRHLRPQAASAGVAMPGWQPHDAVLDAMASSAEPFGLTALEAMACGAALLCSPRGGLAEVIGDAAIPIDPDDPAAIARAMLNLAADPVRRAARAAAGRARAALFDLPHAAARLATLRRSVLAAWPSGATRPI